MTFDDVIKNRKKWEKALASGEYTPTHYVLNILGTNKCCCLGVGCLVILPGQGDSSYDGNKDEKCLSFPMDDGRNNTGYAPPELTKALGLYSDHGAHKTESKKSLTVINDMNDADDYGTVLDALKTGEYYMTREEWVRKCHV